MNQQSGRRRWVARPASVFAITLASTLCIGGAAQAKSTDATAVRAARAVTTVTVGWPAQPQTLDPDLAFDYVSLAALHLIGGNLFTQRPNGSIVNGLASKVSTSRDGLTWRFSLRTGARFSNGAPVTAQDVKATFDRARKDKANGSAGLFKPIVSVSGPTKSNVVIKLNRRYTAFRTILAEPAFMIVPKALLAQGKKFFNAPVSAGMFKLTAWGGGQQATFERNSNYWGTPSTVKTVRFVTIADPSARIAQLQSKQIDLAFNVPPTLIPQLKSSSDLTTTVVPTYGFAGVTMNNADPTLSTSNVRKAISLAIDRGQINQTVWAGEILPLAGFWPQTMQGYDRSISVAQNLTRATALLKGTPCESGCTVELIYDTASAWKAPTALLIQSDLKKIGITVKLVQLDFGTYISRAFGAKFQLALGYLADFADVPDGMASYGLLKDGGESSFFSGYSSPAMTVAVQQALTTQGSKRKSALAAINRIFVQDAPYATLFDYAYVIASRQPKSVVSVDASGFVDVGLAG